MKNRHVPFMVQCFKKAQKRLGARIHIESEWQFALQVKRADGSSRYILSPVSDINPAGAVELARDKAFATYFLTRHGYQTVPGKTFFSDSWCEAIMSDHNLHAACQYAQSIGYPVIAKPNRGSQGRSVYMVHNESALRQALTHIFAEHRVALVQPFVQGFDYRIVVLDDEVKAVYRRTPFYVVGDGKTTIESLMKKALRNINGKGKKVLAHPTDPRILHKLAASNLTFTSVPKKGEHIFLLDNANLSSGGTAEDVTHAIHPYFKQMAIRVTKDMGLRLCGVDMLIEGDCCTKTSHHAILEINGSPGLEHFAHLGKKQQRMVEDLYCTLLKKLIEVKE